MGYISTKKHQVLLCIAQILSAMKMDVTTYMTILYSLNVQGFPLHKIELKINASVMLLRNLDINSGLCNWTTLQILSINHEVLRVKITNGSHVANIGLIPRIDLSPSEISLAFRMRRRRFPIRPSIKHRVKVLII